MATGYTLDSTVTLYAMPLHAIALWPPQNELNPKGRTWLVTLASCLLLLSTLIVSVRICSRITGFAGRIGWDDVLISIAWVSSYSDSLLLQTLVNHRFLELFLQDLPYGVQSPESTLPTPHSNFPRNRTPWLWPPCLGSTYYFMDSQWFCQSFSTKY